MYLNKEKIILILLYTLSIGIMLSGLGYMKSWSNYNFAIASFMFFCYLFSSKNKFTLALALISFSIISFYFPTGFVYGKPTAEILGPLLQTNKLEVIGYINAMKYGILLSFVFILLQIGIYYFNKNKLSKKRYVLPFLIFYSLSLYGASINGFQLNDSAPIKSSIDAYKSIVEQKEEQKKYIKNSENVTVSILNDDDQTEVMAVIIGESVRKDYMSIYGYPNNTTPYLNKANGIFIDGLVAAAPNTEQSLTRSLFKATPTENKIDWGINFVSLANKAKYETYWISNQGRSEHGDDIIFNLAKLTNESNFLKDGSFSSGNHDDEEMLPILTKIVKNNSNRKVIFIHMMGSHEPVCSRLGNFKSSFELFSEASCYAASIEKLDFFIKQVTDILKEKKYKLMYFSDHGLSVDKKRVFHDADLKEEYEVPLFYLDSESTQKNHVKKSISGLNLLDIYATFINIKTNITDEKYNFHSISRLNDDTDPIIFWQKYKNISSIQKKQPPVTDLGASSIANTNTVELKDNFLFSNKCVSYIDAADTASPLSPLYKIHGWAASNIENKPLNEEVGIFSVNNDKVYFTEGRSVARNDVRNHFKHTENEINTYGIEGLVNKKYVENKEKIYFGYKDKLNKYTICNRW